VNSNDDTKYRDVINTLNQLQQVKAPAGFEAGLMQRIKSESFPEKETFRQSIFIPSRIIPTAALAITALLLIFILNDTALHQDNPLLTVPKEREDITLKTESNGISGQEKPVANRESAASDEISGVQKDNDLKKESGSISTQKPGGYDRSTRGNIAANTSGNDRFITADFSPNKITDYPVNKAGLNFRQVNLSNKQKMQLNQLKEKMEVMFRARTKN
jgi:hypothetical protein